MKIHRLAVLFVASLFCMAGLVACGSNKSACSEEDPLAPLPYITPLPKTTTHDVSESDFTSAIVDFKGNLISVDRVVHGDFCADHWSGTVFVDCDIEIAEWEEVPNFLDDCGLSIEEGTVVYVAAHNNQPYYKGCSCHYSDEKFPESSGP
jgi:hypothetical protein